MYSRTFDNIGILRKLRTLVPLVICIRILRKLREKERKKKKKVTLRAFASQPKNHKFSRKIVALAL